MINKFADVKKGFYPLFDPWMDDNTIKWNSLNL